MKISVSKKYLTLPINNKAVRKKLCFYENGRLVFDLDCKIDMLNPDFTAYVDVGRFIGKKLTVTVSPEMEFEIGTAEVMDMPGLYSEQYRPQIHYSVPNGWNNDPNGLVYLDGVYHMFYQYNPCSTEWGNMHWGHAVSRDLLHWETKDIALFPDETGTMYSGSAVIDKGNILGLQVGDTPVMLLYYTAAAGRNLLSEGRKTTQCLAYSADGGISFIKYDGNPVLGHIDACNRDPKTVFVPEIGRYIMALYITDNRYQMFSSTDFIHWQFFDEIILANERECPDLYPLECEGRRIWVLEGASDVYVTGHFEKDRFAVDSTEKKLTYGSWLYAAQSYSNLPGDSVIKIFWNRSRIPGKRFSQQMSIPVQMHLERHHDGIYLAALPIDGIKTLRKEAVADGSLCLDSEKSYNTGSNPLDITVRAAYDADAKLKLVLFGQTLTVDMTKNLLTVSCDGTVKMPLSLDRRTLDLRIIADSSCLEIYADNGKFICAAAMLCDFNLPRISVSSDRVLTLDGFSCYTLEAVHG